MRLVLLILIALVGCQPSTGPAPTPPQSEATPTDESALEPERLMTWAGDYLYEEAEDRFTFLYALHLDPSADGFDGTLDVDGWQTHKRLSVRGASDGDRLAVIATGTRPDHTGETPAVGDTLFVLESVSGEGAPDVVTRWRSLEPSLPDTPRLGVAFDRLGAPADWAMTPRGAGNLVIGMTLDQARAAGAELSARGVAQGDCAYARPLGGPKDLGVMLIGDRVARIEAWSDSEVRTDTGIGIGSTEAEVRRAYPDLTAEPHVYTDGQYLNVDLGDERQLVFETDEAGVVSSFRVGSLPEVGWVEGCS